jgi:hypothetical protein
MTTKTKRERGVAMVLAALFLLAVVMVSAMAIEVSRLTDTATEVQVAADAAALAAAQSMLDTSNQASARTAAQTVAAKNGTDGRYPASTDVNVEFGSYSAAGGYSNSAPIPGTSVTATRATITMGNVRYLLATVFGAGSSTTVAKQAVAVYACTGTAQPGAPLTICDCGLTPSTQGEACSPPTGSQQLTQTPDGSQNSCFLANPSDDQAWFPPGCFGGTKVAPVSVGDTVTLFNGQMTPNLRDFASCVGDGLHDFVIPVIHCSSSGSPPACSIGNCNHSSKVVGFATIHINQSSDINSHGNNKSITYTQVCNANAPGTPGPASAACLGTGNVKLVL